jgi:ABC-2 type transport system ATP-binding protein
MLTVERLRMSFGPVVALDDISFSVGDGIIAVAGPNGAGKTTLMRILAGALVPERGKVEIDGIDAASDPMGVKALTGAMFENAPIYRGMTVEEHLRFSARVRGFSGNEARLRADRAIASCGLHEVRGRLTDGLSRGFRQRAALASAILHEPSLLILDEPSSGLDPVQIADFWALVNNLSPGRTILISTHNLSEIERLGAFVVLVNRGRVVATGSVADILSSSGADNLASAFAFFVKGVGASE